MTTLLTSRDSSRSAAPSPKHFAYIDAVRGVAFIAVLLVHVAYMVGRFPGQWIFQNGGYGVQLFFLASAVTLCSSMRSRERVDPHPVLFFYIRRLFRIAPLFWLAMAAYWIVPSATPRFILTQWAPGGVHPSYFVLTALFMHGWHPYTFNSIVPGGWSIAVEMNFYLLFPILYRFLGRSARNSAAAVLGSVILLDAFGSLLPLLRSHLYGQVPDPVWRFYKAFWLPSQLPVFLIGFLLYHLLRQESVLEVVRDRVWAMLILAACSLTALGALTSSVSRVVPDYVIMVVAMAGGVLSLSEGALPWIVNPVICYIGRISYSCYLVHFAALGIALRILRLHFTGTATSFDAGSAMLNMRLFVELSGLTVCLTVLLASITLKVIEEPGIALGKTVLKRLRERSEKKTLVAVTA